PEAVVLTLHPVEGFLRATQRFDQGLRGGGPVTRAVDHSLRRFARVRKERNESGHRRSSLTAPHRPLRGSVQPLARIGGYGDQVDTALEGARGLPCPALIGSMRVSPPRGLPDRIRRSAPWQNVINGRVAAAGHRPTD